MYHNVEYAPYFFGRLNTMFRLKSINSTFTGHARCCLTVHWLHCFLFRRLYRLCASSFRQGGTMHFLTGIWEAKRLGWLWTDCSHNWNRCNWNWDYRCATSSRCRTCGKFHAGYFEFVSDAVIIFYSFRNFRLHKSAFNFLSVYISSHCYPYFQPMPRPQFSWFIMHSSNLSIA